MKKRLFCLLAAVLIVTTVFATVGFADFGDFAGGNDWGGGSDWGDSSWDSDWDSSDDYYYSGSDGDLSGGNVFWMAAIVIAVIVIGAIGNKNGGSRRRANTNTQPAKPLVNRLDELKKKDPNFSEAKFLDDASNLYVRMQNCWTDKNLEPIRPHLSAELYAKSEAQIDGYKRRNETDHVERVSVLSANIVGCNADNVNDIVTVQIVARITDYVTDDNTGAIIRGSKNKELFMTYQWTFIRSLGKTTAADGGIDSEHCPNCGAPLDLNRSAVCSYCGATITSGDYDWVVSNIKGISQRSV